jgi:hypothetical protein
MPPNDTIDTAERLVRLETKLDFLIKSMENLPPSPTCIRKHEELEERVTAMEKFVNRAVGALIAVNILITVFAYKLKGFI